jgi:hypothetical protein
MLTLATSPIAPSVKLSSSIGNNTNASAGASALISCYDAIEVFAHDSIVGGLDDRC